MLHYNFPPYSVGEAGRVGSPGRREIGHGKLAKRGVQVIMPSQEEFPYVIRVVSEITESNGSSSMPRDGDRIGRGSCRYPLLDVGRVSQKGRAARGRGRETHG